MSKFNPYRYRLYRKLEDKKKFISLYDYLLRDHITHVTYIGINLGPPIVCNRRETEVTCRTADWEELHADSYELIDVFGSPEACIIYLQEQHFELFL